MEVSIFDQWDVNSCHLFQSILICMEAADIVDKKNINE